MAVKLGLFHRTLHADHHIAQHLAAGFRVDIIHPVLPQRKAENIGGHGLIAVFVVQLGNTRIIHKGHAYFCVSFKTFIFEHRVAGTANENAHSRRHLDGFLLITDKNFVGHNGFLLSYISVFSYLLFFLFRHLCTIRTWYQRLSFVSAARSAVLPASFACAARS